MAAPIESVRLILQSDWDQSLRETNGKAWVSCRQPGQPTIYGELKGHGLSSEAIPYVTASDGFKLNSITSNSLSLSYGSGDAVCSCRFQSPSATFTALHSTRKSVVSLDVTPGGLAVSADTDGKLKIWLTATGEVRIVVGGEDEEWPQVMSEIPHQQQSQRELIGHYGDVYTCRYFPSGLVVLSGGADTRLKIWSAETGQCAATLTGHRAGVTDTAVVDRGRNVLSCSNDGTAKLWDCGKSACIATFEECGGPLNACCLGIPNSDVQLGVPDKPPNEREVMTEGKLLLLAGENGTLQGWGLHSKQQIFDYKCTSAVNCCAFVSSTAVVCGTQDSQIITLDLRNTSIPLKLQKECRSAILSLLPHQGGIIVSTGDGSCFMSPEGENEKMLELTGPDCDPVYSVAYDGQYIYTACRDGSIRKYIDSIPTGEPMPVDR